MSGSVVVSHDKLEFLERFLNFKKKYAGGESKFRSDSVIMRSFSRNAGMMFFFEDVVDYNDYMDKAESFMRENFQGYVNYDFESVNIVSDEKIVSKVNYFYGPIYEIMESLCTVSEFCEESRVDPVFISEVNSVMEMVSLFFFNEHLLNSRSVYWYSQEVEEALGTLVRVSDHLVEGTDSVLMVKANLDKACRAEGRIDWFVS